MDLPSANQMNCAFSCMIAIVLTVEVAGLASVSGVSRIEHVREVWRKNMCVFECLNGKLFITCSYFGVSKNSNFFFKFVYVEVPPSADMLY
jgi:hypothetical protein